jgi:excisionase family DNA binding protein
VAVPDAIDALFEQDPPTLGAALVAERLGTTPKTVYGWLRDGLIPGYRVGTTWFIITDELKDTLRRGANTLQKPRLTVHEPENTKED